MSSFINRFFIVFFALTSFLLADKSEDLRLMMKAKAEFITVVLKDSTLSKDDKNEKIAKSTDPLFDYYLMAKLSLSKKWWSEFSSAQRKEYSKLLEKRLKQAYLDKLHLYTDEKVLVDKAKQVKKNRIQVLATIKTENDDTDMLYKFYHSKNDDWLIYDVEIAGVSIIQTYRAQFAEILENKSIVEFLDKLKTEKE